MTTTTAATDDWIADGIAETWGLARIAVRRLADDRDTVVLVEAEGLPRGITRLLRPGRVGVTAVESEVAWMSALGDDGVVQVPTAIRTPAGTAVGVIDGPGGARWPAVTVEYEPLLVSPPTLPPDAAMMATLGELAATLHAHARDWRPPAWFRRPSLELIDLAGQTDHDWGELPLRSTALSLLGTAQEEALDTVSWAREPQGLVHGSLRRGVVLARRPLLRSFECRWTWWEQDLAGSLSGLEDRVDAPSMARAWLSAYGDGLDLRLAGALVMLRRLALLGSDPSLAEGTVEVATRYLGSPTWLFD